MNKVVCFGEMLLRLSPGLNQQWIRSETTPVFLGGAELNVASALARWGIAVKYCSALPDNFLTTEIIQEIHDRQIETAIDMSGARVGIYYLPAGADIKHTGVIYDRDHSSFSSLVPGMINWDEVFEDASWFHFSAISPALNKNIVAICHEAVDAAVKKNMTISVDLNYREKLWQSGEQPCSIMPDLVRKCTVVMGNIWAAESLLGLHPSIKNSWGRSVRELTGAAEESMEQLQTAYPNVRDVAYTFRLPAAYFGVLRHDSETTISRQFLLKESIDKVGSGDCFMAGLIYGLMLQHPAQELLDFAAAAATGKLAEKGDSTKNNIANILKIVQNG